MADLIKIAVDAMGGDNSPKKVIDGLILNHKNNKENLWNFIKSMRKRWKSVGPARLGTARLGSARLGSAIDLPTICHRFAKDTAAICRLLATNLPTICGHLSQTFYRRTRLQKSRLLYHMGFSFIIFWLDLDLIS